MSYEMKIKYSEWVSLKDEIFKLKQLKLKRDAELKEIRWLVDRKIWHPGTRLKYILEKLDEMGVEMESTTEPQVIELAEC